MPEPVTDRCRRDHEHWFHFTISRSYYSNCDDLRASHTAYAGFHGHAKTYGAQRNDDRRRNVANVAELGRPLGSVWTCPIEPLMVPASVDVEHFAAFPSELVRRIVLGWSPRGAVVLDPFSGTGTTAAVASHLARVGIGFDLSAAYVRLARWRASDPKLRAKVLRTDVPPQQITGQASLFEAVQ